MNIKTKNLLLLLFDSQVSILIFFSKLAQVELFALHLEYDSVCTLLPRKVFSFTGYKKIRGRVIAKSFTPPEAVGQCMNLCEKHGQCNAINFKKNVDTENCLFVEAGRIVETDDDSDWLGYETNVVCMDGCYRNAGMCLYQLPITEAKFSAKVYNLEKINDRDIPGKAFSHTRVDQANAFLWMRMDLGKTRRVVRVVLYITKKATHDNQVFSVRVGSHEESNDEAVKKARYCAYDVSKYPGEVDELLHVTRKDVYCDGPLEGRFAYFSKYTTTDNGNDQLSFQEVVVFGEKM